MKSRDRWNTFGTWIAGTAGALSASDSGAQSLLRAPPAAVVNAAGDPDPQAPLRGYSLTMVEAPEPRTFAVHDKVTIIISELSKQTATSKLDTKKDVKLKAGVKQLPSLSQLLELIAETDEGSPITGVDLSANPKFKGDGKYERSDRFTDRITATIIDVKPNGVLVLEAKRTIAKDDEVQSLVLAGECRREDVTDSNSVLSSQLADMTLIVRNEGEVKDAASKGLLTRVFESVFNF